GFDSKISEIKVATQKAERWRFKLTQMVSKAVADRLDQHRIESFRLFQTMIPTPYQFENISILTEDKGVRLGLRYRGMGEDVGEPRYFLSSAQANVLALSYFLSFSSRQCWCKLDTMFMDDPVQHLDDLDAVAMLDLLRSLLSQGRKKKQLILSTCDLNLFG